LEYIVNTRIWFASVAQPAYQVHLLSAPPITIPVENADGEPPGDTLCETEPAPAEYEGNSYLSDSSLSVILPAYNEEDIIAYTVKKAVRLLSMWVRDLEVLVVNDGSTDKTKVIVEELALAYPCVHLINHPVNQGYGAALVSGFEAASKDVIFLMDADGQFDIRDLGPFFSLLEAYDAVLGYRIACQDTLLRKVTAWGWALLIRATLGLSVRDVDCAFKLFRADFFRKRRLETRGAMINTEILYKWIRAGYSYTQMGVHHFPRIGGKATGAKPVVILCALKELAICVWKWRLEEARSFQPKVTVRL
jgi:glycosyltransferase involved in cell wall biosynthesis